MCMVVIFRENSPVAILAADSKRSFWAACTVMKNCRSQFAWPRAQLKESAIRRVVERQVVYNSWTTGPGADSAAAVSAAAVSAADSSSGAGNGCATSTAATSISWIALGVSSSPAVVVTKNLWTLLVPVSRARSSPVPGVAAYFRPGYAAGQE